MLKELKAKRAQLVTDAEALRGSDGTFKDDAARAAFDAKMATVEALDNCPLESKVMFWDTSIDPEV